MTLTYQETPETWHVTGRPTPPGIDYARLDLDEHERLWARARELDDQWWSILGRLRAVGTLDSAERVRDMRAEMDRLRDEADELRCRAWPGLLRNRRDDGPDSD